MSVCACVSRVPFAPGDSEAARECVRAHVFVCSSSSSFRPQVRTSLLMSSDGAIRQVPHLPLDASPRRLERGMAWFLLNKGFLCDGGAFEDDTLPLVAKNERITVVLDMERGYVRFSQGDCVLGTIEGVCGTDLRFFCYCDGRESCCTIVSEQGSPSAATWQMPRLPRPIRTCRECLSQERQDADSPPEEPLEIAFAEPGQLAASEMESGSHIRGAGMEMQHMQHMQQLADEPMPEIRPGGWSGPRAVMRKGSGAGSEFGLAWKHGVSQQEEGKVMDEIPFGFGLPTSDSQRTFSTSWRASFPPVAGAHLPHGSVLSLSPGGQAHRGEPDRQRHEASPLSISADFVRCDFVVGPAASLGEGAGEAAVNGSMKNVHEGTGDGGVQRVSGASSAPELEMIAAERRQLRAEVSLQQQQLAQLKLERELVREEREALASERAELEQIRKQFRAQATRPEAREALDGKGSSSGKGCRDCQHTIRGLEEECRRRDEVLWAHNIASPHEAPVRQGGSTLPPTPPRRRVGGQTAHVQTVDGHFNGFTSPTGAAEASLSAAGGMPHLLSHGPRSTQSCPPPEPPFAPGDLDTSGDLNSVQWRQRNKTSKEAEVDAMDEDHELWSRHDMRELARAFSLFDEGEDKVESLRATRDVLAAHPSASPGREPRSPMPAQEVNQCRGTGQLGPLQRPAPPRAVPRPALPSSFANVCNEQRTPEQEGTSAGRVSFAALC